MTHRKNAALGWQARQAAETNVHALRYRQGRCLSRPYLGIPDALVEAFAGVSSSPRDRAWAAEIRHRTQIVLASEHTQTDTRTVQPRITHIHDQGTTV
jgi:hypothetical protein